MTLAFTLDVAAVFVFALTGALAASRAQLDIVGFLFFAALTAVGGGTVRDLLLDQNPVFWINEPIVLLVAATAAVLVFFSAHLVESRAQWLAWLDAAALSIAVPAGLAVAIATGQSGFVAPIVGVLTGTFGGLMRDVVANEVPMVLRQGELYVTAAFLGALTGWYVSGYLATGTALVVAGLVTFLLRAGSLAFGWRLPVYKSRPPR
ncbi:MAG: trimeric intracellular cation channel family protein [Boseongicola sp.]|nr:trimeric intracellular cation channel family protein [Boseongicola sp.]NNJ68930.1 trimeric intracellular cation channel family protein [Boseongicola sp.]